MSTDMSSSAIIEEGSDGSEDDDVNNSIEKDKSKAEEYDYDSGLEVNSYLALVNETLYIIHIIH